VHCVCSAWRVDAGKLTRYAGLGAVQSNSLSHAEETKSTQQNFDIFFTDVGSLVAITISVAGLATTTTTVAIVGAGGTGGIAVTGV
jgi:hypothetical protein